MKSETWNFARDFSVYFLIHLFLHNVCGLNLNLSINILYLVTFTFILAKHKMATKMLNIFYSLSHMKAFICFARFVIDNFFSCLWKEINLIRPLNLRYQPFFMYLLLLYTAKDVDEKMTYF